MEAPTAALSDAGAERGTEGGGRDAREKRSAIVMAEFTTACDGRPLTKAKEALMVRYECRDMVPNALYMYMYN